MSKTVLVPIADGSEEIEAVTIVDTLRRAGATVTVAAVGDRLEVQCSRGVRLVADTLLARVRDQRFDLIALPGGQRGAERLRDSDGLVALLRDQVARDAPVGAVCAAPGVVLATHDLLGGRQVTSHPSVFETLPAATRREDRVVVDGSLVTSRGPGTALEFALALVELLYGAAQREAVAGPMLVAKGMR